MPFGESLQGAPRVIFGETGLRASQRGNLALRGSNRQEKVKTSQKSLKTSQKTLKWSPQGPTSQKKLKTSEQISEKKKVSKRKSQKTNAIFPEH